MNKKLLILALVVFAGGLLGFCIANQVTAASESPKGAGDSVQVLKARVDKLEAQVSALQAQFKELASQASSKVLTLPGTHVFPGNKIPPGAVEREFNGMKYWLVPLNDGHQN
jgi:outer membrane murein-binding lipoprotein Lpp